MQFRMLAKLALMVHQMSGLRRSSNCSSTLPFWLSIILLISHSDSLTVLTRPALNWELDFVPLLQTRLHNQLGLDP